MGISLMHSLVSVIKIVLNPFIWSYPLSGATIMPFIWLAEVLINPYIWALFYIAYQFKNEQNETSIYTGIAIGSCCIELILNAGRSCSYNITHTAVALIWSIIVFASIGYVKDGRKSS